MCFGSHVISICLLTFFTTVLAASLDSGLTPAQKKILQRAAAVAPEASARAEKQLLERFGTATFRVQLAAEGVGKGSRLAELPVAELLAQLKKALSSLEYTSNFGLDDESRRLNPGNAALGPADIDDYRRVPTMWDLLNDSSPLAVNVSHVQWAIMDAAETGLYDLPNFHTSAKPSATEAAQRPQYLAGNLRRQALGVQRYGSYNMILRGDVVQRRALLIGADSGGWESGCNSSVRPVREPNWFMKRLEKYAFACDPVRSTPFGVSDHMLHTLLANSETFGMVGGGLARLVYQLLEPSAETRPLEVNMYTEGALLGDLVMDDLKAIVADFPGLFGTKQAEDLRSFCKRHGLPLAWGLGAARPWPQEAARSLSWLPLEDLEFWPVGAGRLLDIDAGWVATNASRFPGSAEQNVWRQCWDEITQARANIDHRPQKEDFEQWWARLAEASPLVSPLRGDECLSTDLCFGTHSHHDIQQQDCVCRQPLQAAKQDFVV